MRIIAFILLLSISLQAQTIPCCSAITSQAGQQTNPAVPTGQPGDVLLPMGDGFFFNITEFYRWLWCQTWGFCGQDTVYVFVVGP